eukprot:TRINITY_DN8251_c0_g1_i1.p1 TRINITY_DN8251_c0_g1~~TRINITY_DN8251_c0_g1_i1.p1  ORF type:complete len:142 (+),score=31.98 TRINITY_DN8251_c0_g1_i1:187-612(+)
MKAQQHDTEQRQQADLIAIQTRLKDTEQRTQAEIVGLQARLKEIEQRQQEEVATIKARFQDTSQRQQDEIAALKARLQDSEAARPATHKYSSIEHQDANSETSEGEIRLHTSITDSSMGEEKTEQSVSRSHLRRVPGWATK